MSTLKKVCLVLALMFVITACGSDDLNYNEWDLEERIEDDADVVLPDTLEEPDLGFEEDVGDEEPDVSPPEDVPQPSSLVEFELESVPVSGAYPALLGNSQYMSMKLTSDDDRCRLLGIEYRSPTSSEIFDKGVKFIVLDEVQYSVDKFDDGVHAVIFDEPKPVNSVYEYIIVSHPYGPETIGREFPDNMRYTVRPLVSDGCTLANEEENSFYRVAALLNSRIWPYDNNLVVSEGVRILGRFDLVSNTGINLSKIDGTPLKSRLLRLCFEVESVPGVVMDNFVIYTAEGDRLTNKESRRFYDEVCFDEFSNSGLFESGLKLEVHLYGEISFEADFETDSVFDVIISHFHNTSSDPDTYVNQRNLRHKLSEVTVIR